jgi:hypothetical protein
MNGKPTMSIATVSEPDRTDMLHLHSSAGFDSPGGTSSNWFHTIHDLQFPQIGSLEVLHIEHFHLWS